MSRRLLPRQEFLHTTLAVSPAMRGARACPGVSGNAAWHARAGRNAPGGAARSAHDLGAACRCAADRSNRHHRQARALRLVNVLGIKGFQQCVGKKKPHDSRVVLAGKETGDAETCFDEIG